MDVKYQIFVSSTFDDLIEERRAVMEAILNLRHIPVGMELFHATDETQWQYIQRRIAECDYYVVIVAERYGSEFEGKSYTQKEYELAVQLGIPVIALLLDGSVRATWPQTKVDFEKKTQVEEFRSLCKQRLVKFWKTSEDLALKVTQSLNAVTIDIPRVGWVRADAVPSLKVVEELSILSDEKRKLQARVEQLSGSESISIPPEVIYRIQQLQMSSVNSYCEGYEIEDDIPSLLDVFLASHKVLATGAELWQMWEVWRESFKMFGNDDHTAVSILGEFASHNLVDFGYKPTSGRGQAKEYRLTEYGKNFAMYAYNYETGP
ncbi:DUF4062 domain-containing protein [Neorhizobium alkalisoli]|uniref:Uncharacterized protein DUF4062 n=1 Tax=Neorhizobium alkalisoli TaxID=528178 RepID=A0A561R293_9HYPH|nr:DUF4062 domain-containing protein [Neorhizobium alkalisoli]TWF56736.1 uncharacterized protein DUF4062 [Neorhizobium alkalisoli]